MVYGCRGNKKRTQLLCDIDLGLSGPQHQVEYVTQKGINSESSRICNLFAKSINTVVFDVFESWR